MRSPGVRRRVTAGVVVTAVAVLAGAALAACGGSASSTASSTSSTTTPPAFVAAAKGVPAPEWLCAPGTSPDPCTTSLTATVIPAHGPTTVQHATVAVNPPIDCFYVYPTVSDQTTVNANLQIDPQERAVARAQASRFSTDCRVYAPMYRQLTLAAIDGKAGGLTVKDEATAYLGVLDAWKYYLAHDNRGRGVVLIGHSQGASMLIALMRNQIDPNPAERRLLVSALVMGGNVTVPVGKRVGGDFAHIPACDSSTDTGCVVAYSSFDATPPANANFGRVGQGVSKLSAVGPPGVPLQVLCVNPASLSDPTATGSLSPYSPTARFPGTLGAAEPVTQVAKTPWVTAPDLYTAHCEYQDGASWLQIDTTHIPGDTRPVVSPTLGPSWGLHLYDINLALGKLTALVHDQSAAYVHAGGA